MAEGTALEEEVLDRNNQLVFEGLAGSALASALLMVTLCAGTEGSRPLWVDAVWVLVGVAISAVRLRARAGFRASPAPRRAREARRWATTLERGALAAGVWWAVGVALLTWPATPEQRFFGGLVGAGVVSGGMMTLIAVPRAYRLFTVPILATYLVVAVGKAQAREEWLMALAVAVFVPVLLRGSRQVSQMMHRTVSLATQQGQMLGELQAARDAALASARARSEFLAVMSHEIRTPLNGVVGMTGLLKETTLSAEQRDFTETIEQSAQALQVLIDDILDFSKIDAGRLELERADFELPLELTRLVRVMTFKAQETGLELELELDPALPRHVKGDWPRLRQVLVNLLGNAIKFTPAGKVRCAVRRLADGALRFEVEDTGVGISPPQLARLFAPFTQADASTSRRFGGTGLGLSISRRLVQLMGGDIEVESELGRGSRFGFTVRLEPGEPVVREAPRHEPGAPARVLLVDDNEINLKLARVLLERVGHTVVVARDGEEALARLAGERFDLVLLDLQMPVLDGYQTARRIRAGSDGVLDPQVPIVALTANATTEDREACLAVGFDDYLTKPVAPQALWASIGRWRGPPSPAPEPEAPGRLAG